MTQVSKEEINSMKDLLTYFDTDEPSNIDNINVSTTTHQYPMRLNETVDAAAVAAMKEDLNAFYQVAAVEINSTIGDNFTHIEQEEIKNTTVLPNGIIYNDWECKHNKRTNEYIIRSISTKQVICVMMMKETALLMLKLLKDNIPLTTSLAQLLFDFDRKYIQAKNDISLYLSKGDMYEGRLQQAEILLESTQEQAKNLLKRYRNGLKLF